MKTTVQRLDQYRREAAAGKWARPLTWRDTRRHHSNPWGAPRFIRAVIILTGAPSIEGVTA